MENKILVYDSSKGFNRFLKLNYRKQYDIVSITDSSNFNQVDFDEYKAVFFIVNSEAELLDLLVILFKAKFLIIGSREKHVMNALMVLEEVVFIDLNLKKDELVQFIDYIFDINDVNVGLNI